MNTLSMYKGICIFLYSVAEGHAPSHFRVIGSFPELMAHGMLIIPQGVNMCAKKNMFKSGKN